MADTPSTGMLPAGYFDGTSGRAQPVTLCIRKGFLLIDGDAGGIGDRGNDGSRAGGLAAEALHRAVPLAEVQWPERTRHGMRVAHFKGGGSVRCADADAWDAWAQSHGRRDSWVVQAQQSWRSVLVCMAALVALLVALQQWGFPAAARMVVAVTPRSVDQSLGETSLEFIDGTLMLPSKLPAADQARYRKALQQAVDNLPPGEIPPWRLEFRKSKIGPNALALPDGTLLMTDGLVELVEGKEDVIVAVLAHELGHVRHRHSLRLLVQATALGGLASVILGDFSSLLAGVPVLLGQASYSRDAEREADAESVHILKAARISPDVMVTLFEKLDEERRGKQKKDGDSSQGGKERETPEEGEEKSDSWLGIAFASHPLDDERVRYFKNAAQSP